MKNIIYGLADSRNDLVYYVGKTSVGKLRPLTHLSNSHSPEVNMWVKTLRENWGDVKVILIEEVFDLDDLPNREVYWIGYYSNLNKALLNKKDFPKLIDSYEEEDIIKFNNLKDSLLFAVDTLKKRRLALNLTQEKLAVVSGVNRWSINQIEAGRSTTLETIKKVCLGLISFSIQKQLVGVSYTERPSKFRKNRGSTINKSL